VTSGVAQSQPAGTRAPLARVGGLRGRALLLDWLLPVALLLALVAVIGIAFWPGRMNADTLAQMDQMRTGAYTDQLAPIIDALWQPFYRNGVGPGWVLTGQLLVFVGSAFSLLRRQFPPLVAAIVVVLISLAPQAFGELALVGRDAWFLSLFVATFAFVDLALATNGRRRLAYTVVALILAWLAIAARQNSVTAVFLPLGLLAAPFLKQRLRERRHARALLIVSATITGILVTVVMYGSQILVDHAIGVQDTHSSGQIYLTDLATMSRDANHDYIPTSVLPSRSMQIIRADSSVAGSAGLLYSPNAPISYNFTAKTASALKHAWIHRIEADPLSWVNARFQLFDYLIGITAPSIWIYHPFIDPNNLGYTTTFTGANKIATDYESSFANSANNGDALFRVWPYLLIAIVIAAVLLRSTDRHRVLAGVIALSVLGYQIGYLLALMNVNYRYEFPALVLCELALALALGIGWRESRLRNARSVKHVSVRTGASGLPVS
jgi:hypothetical protein